MAEYIAREETMKRIREIGDENYKGKYPHIGMVHAEKLFLSCPPQMLSRLCMGSG